MKAQIAISIDSIDEDELDKVIYEIESLLGSSSNGDWKLKENREEES